MFLIVYFNNAFARNVFRSTFVIFSLIKLRPALLEAMLILSKSLICSRFTKQKWDFPPLFCLPWQAKPSPGACAASTGAALAACGGVPAALAEMPPAPSGINTLPVAGCKNGHEQKKQKTIGILWVFTADFFLGTYRCSSFQKDMFMRF